VRNGSSGFDKLLKHIWKYDVNKMNDHLPRKTLPLDELLKQERPVIEARDRSKIWIDREELLKVANLIPAKMHGILHLPIILIRRIDLGEGAFSIGGGKLEAFLVAKVLGVTNDSFTNYERAEIPQHLYRPQVQEVRRRLKTLSVIGFAGADEQGF
jgi:uncharacterized protein (UPF0216 family)